MENKNLTIDSVLPEDQPNLSEVQPEKSPEELKADFEELFYKKFVEVKRGRFEKATQLFEGRTGRRLLADPIDNLSFTKDELLVEWDRILKKESRLPRSQRDCLRGLWAATLMGITHPVTSDNPPEE